MEKKEFRFASEQEFVGFLSRAKLSPTLCEKALAPFRILPNLTANLSSLPFAGKSQLWEGGPEVEYVDAVAHVESRKIGKSGARVLHLRAIPLLSLLTDEDEPGAFPPEFSCGAMNPNDAVRGWCGFLLQEIEEAKKRHESLQAKDGTI